MENVKKRKFKVRWIIELALLALFIVGWIVSWHMVVEKKDLDLVEGEAGNVRIALITDLHSCYYGRDMDGLISKVDEANPDIVIMSGDFFDDKLNDKNSKIVAEDLVKKYPCFYVTGNHEYWSDRVDEMKDYMKSIGVVVLEGDCVTTNINGVDVDICGVDDPTYMAEQDWQKQIDAAYAKTNPKHLSILASHRPEKVSIYEQYDFDLILAGHAHAGQVKIPFIKRGMFAPDQGVIAEYIDGTYELKSGSIMEVSRGLARESTPLPRFFNNPELVILDIH